jgi:uncharacterized protein YfaS (alpha-2-macroglobulin family)
MALLCVTRLPAQSPALQVLRHTPGDTATPGNVITVTFDRPVAGQLGATVDPARIFHLSPAIPGRVEWRDPVTIRFIPDQPLTPGTRIAVTLDTTFRAFDGSRLAKRWAFAFRVPGPRLLARSFGDDDSPGAPATLPLDGGIQLLYSAPMDLARLQSGAHIELAAQCTGGARTVALRAVRQRTVSKDDPWEFHAAGGWNRDTTADHFRRVVELKPAQPLPLECPGVAVLPNTTEDLAYGGTERFAIETAANFRLRPFECSDGARCPMNDLVLRFTAPVRRGDVLQHVRLEPAVPLVLDADDVPSGDWRVKLTLAPRTTYTVVADSTLRDVYGRALAGPSRTRVVTGDFVPNVSYPAGMLTMPRTGPRTLPVSHVNVRTMRVVSYRIPTADRAPMFAAGPDGLEHMLDSLPDLRPETTFVQFDARLNVPDTSEIPLAGGAASDTQLVALRMEIARVVPGLLAGSSSQKAIPLTARGIDGVSGYLGPGRITLVQRTDLALHARVSPGHTVAFVTGLLDGAPRAGATVREMNPSGAVTAQGVTGADGIAQLEPLPGQPALGPAPSDALALPGWHFSSPVVEATLGSDRVAAAELVRRLGYFPNHPLNPEQLGGRTEDPPAVTAALFSDRGIYRPGEMLYLKGVIRTGVLGALVLPPAADTARVRLMYRPHPWSSDEDVVVHDTVVAMSDFGTVADSLRLRAGATPGSYVATLELVTDTTWRTVASEELRVAEYRAPEFLAEAHTDSAPHFGGDTIAVQLSAKYLFGAPMAGVRVQWNAELHEVSPWDVHIPGADGWLAGESDWWDSLGEDAERPQELAGQDTLDATGRLTLHVPIGELHASRPGQVSIDVAVGDVNRQTITTSAVVPVHPARLYVLARKQSHAWYWTRNAPATIEIRTVTPLGTPLGDVPVAVAVVRREWMPDTTGSGGAGTWTEHTVKTDTVRTGLAPVTYTFIPREAGPYDVRLTAPDGHGAIARTTMGGWVAGDGFAWGTDNPFLLKLVADPRPLAVGDSTSVMFMSPFDDAEAWITMEREHVLAQRRIRVKRGTNIVPIRIETEDVPNVFVSVLLVRRGSRATSRPDSASQLLRVGYVELKVGTATKRLAVDVHPESAGYQPGDTALVRVAVHDNAGHGVRSEVTLWAVDQGVLALTAFHTPDLLDLLYQPRGVGARLVSTIPSILARESLTIRGVAMMLSEVVVTGVAGTADSSAVGQAYATTARARTDRGLSGPALRIHFRSTAFFLASVVTDSTGHAAARARLPDNLTTYRVMAVAVSADDRYGSGDSTLLVTRALVARPSLPRFVRPSDSLLAGAVVNDRDGSVRRVTVRVESNGMPVRGVTRRDIVLARGKGAEARFDFTVPPRDSVRDTVVVRLGASDGVHSDAVESRLAVRPDYHPRAHTQLGMVRSDGDVVMMLPAGIDAARSRLSMRLGTSPLAPMLAAYHWLRAYPFDCTEQLSSVGFALAAVWHATREREPDALGGDPLARLQELADAVAGRQRDDGAIRYWNDDKWSSPWLSAYAGLFLLEARDLGATVDSTTLARLSDYLRDTADAAIDTGGMNRFERRDHRLELGERVAAVDFLRRANMEDESAEDALLNVAPVMTWEDRLRLAEVLASRTDRRSEARALVDAAWKTVIRAGNRVDLPDTAHAGREFPSHVAPAARLLTASLALRPDEPLLGGLVETVLQQGRAERGWAWTTQDYASAVIALAALADTNASAREVRVRAGGREILAERTTGSDPVDSVPLTGLLEPARNGQTALRLHLSATPGAQPVYYALTVEEVPSAPPVTPDIQGIVVERWYERLSDGQPVTSVKEGDLVRVRLRVTVPSDRQFVAVEDPLPAGLEPVDLSLLTSGTLKPFLSGESEAAEAASERDGDSPLWQRWLYGSWDDGWWSPWEHKAIYDDRVVYFARMLWAGTYTASYVARATTAGNFVRPPAHAEEMYNPGLQGRSDGGRFGVQVAGAAP